VNTATRFTRGVGPEPHSYRLPHDLASLPMAVAARAWLDVPQRPAVPPLSGQWIAADLKGCEPE